MQRIFSKMNNFLLIFSILPLKGWSGDSNWWRHFWTAPKGYLLVLILKINSIGDWHFQLQHYVKVSAFVALFLYPTWLDIVVSKFAVESKKKVFSLSSKCSSEAFVERQFLDGYLKYSPQKAKYLIYSLADNNYSTFWHSSLT